MTYLDQIKNLLAGTKVAGLATRVKHNSEMLHEVSEWPASAYCNSLIEKIYCYANQMSTPAKCVCGQPVSFVSVTKGYREFCARECTHAMAAATQRRVAVLNSRGGVGLANPKSRARAQQTLQKLHGVSNAFCLPQVVEKRILHNPMKDPQIIENIRQNCLQTHGVNWHSKRSEVISKRENTIVTKYGVSNTAQKDYAPHTVQVLNDPQQLRSMFESTNVQMMAHKLGVCETTIFKYLRIWGIRQPNEIAAEIQLNTWLKEQAFNDFVKSRTALNNKQEIDLYSESQNIGIEYCGLYWHSQAYKTRSYHRNKYLAGVDQGIKLITIFEDEWINKSQIVKSRLSQILGINQKAAGARSLTVSIIPSNVASEFLDTYHISGSARASVYIGAYDKDQNLVAVMTFSQGRKFVKPKHDWEWEMVRFSTNGLHYPGVAAKLFSHFVKKHHPSSVLSYADLRWGQGQYLAHLGFHRWEDTPPNYWYFSLKNADLKRYHRFTFNKQALVKKYPQFVNDQSTEYSLAQEAGLERIWDCGNAKWIWYANATVIK